MHACIRETCKMVSFCMCECNKSFPIGLLGAHFPKVKTAAYSALRLWVGVGLSLDFLLTIYVSHEVLLWISLVVAIIALPMYSIVDSQCLNWAIKRTLYLK